jgi:GNAT superfamily N-acetyltransferase
MPPIPGLVFRPFRGEEDYAGMSAVISGSKEADGLEWATSAEEVARTYRHLVNCDPATDMFMVDVEGSGMVGYARCSWYQQRDAARLYWHFAHLRADWRGKGIRRAMLRRNEARLRQIAAGHPDDGPKLFEAGAADTETHWRSVLEDAGYEPVRWGFHMVRPDLEDIPDLPLPEGLEVRPALPHHYHQVWRALDEAFRDHWGSQEWKEEDLEEWMDSPTFDPSLWQVAWDGDEVAGTVLPFISEEENEEYGRKRGYTEYICTRRPWRRRGLARALIARALQAVKDRGMEEASLGVDTQNLSGALRLYQSMGFCKVKEHTTYRNPI